MRKPKTVSKVPAKVGGAVLSMDDSPRANGRAKNSAQADGGVLTRVENQKIAGSPEVSALCVQLQELQVRRKFCIKATTKLTNAAGALARRALGFHYENDEKENEKVKGRASKIVATAMKGKPQDKEDREIYEAISPELLAIRFALNPLTKRRKEVEKAMVRTALQLPAYAGFAKSVKGFGDLGFAVVVGEAGDLANYPSVRHLWKRLGLAPYEGSAYSTWRKKGGLSAEEWVSAGYKPSRLAEIYACVTESMAKHQLESAEKSGTEFGKPKQKYGEVYVARREAKKHSNEMTKAHQRMDALRVMTKALIEDLWKVWRGSAAGLAETPKSAMAPAAPIKPRAAAKLNTSPVKRKKAA